MPDYEKGDDAVEAGVPSKSERKRQMHALQALGETLVGLSEKQLSRVPIEDEHLVETIRECRAIRSNSARKRHLQLIGKLMRNIDPAPIENALNTLHEKRQRAADTFHDLEQLRDDILAAANDGEALALARWPDADRQQLRQLVLQHRREQQRGKPPAASRKLFRYLRELQEDYGDTG